MVIRKPNELQLSIKKVLVAAGVSEPNAECVAEHMVASQLCGVDTHGMFHTPLYLEGLKKGHIDPTPPPILQENSQQRSGDGKLDLWPGGGAIHDESGH